MDSTGSLAGGKPHAVCMPFPVQGHVIPMMMMAKVLHSKGFYVTFVHTEYNHRRLVRSRGAGAVMGLPDFRFATIPDGLPPSDADATQDVVSICTSTMTTCLPHFRALLKGLNGSDDVPPVTCVVADVCLTFSIHAAADLGVPCALLWTASACGFLGIRHYRLLIEQGLVPLRDAEQLTNGFLDTPVGWARGMSKHMRLRDFPSFLRTTDRDDPMLNFAMHEIEHSADSTAIIYNTFDELEQPALDALPSARLHGRPAQPARPVGRPARRAGLQPLEGGPRLPRLPRQQRLPVPVGRQARPGEGRRRRGASGVPGGHAGQGPPGELVPAGGGAAARRGWAVPHAQRVELHAGEHLLRGAHALVALLRRPADEFSIQVHGVGRGDGGWRRCETRGCGEQDKGGHGRGEGEGDEEEGDGVEGGRCSSNTIRGQLIC